jgi:hypothetical protein
VRIRPATSSNLGDLTDVEPDRGGDLTDVEPDRDRDRTGPTFVEMRTDVDAG